MAGKKELLEALLSKLLKEDKVFNTQYTNIDRTPSATRAFANTGGAGKPLPSVSPEKLIDRTPEGAYPDIPVFNDPDLAKSSKSWYESGNVVSNERSADEALEAFTSNRLPNDKRITDTVNTLEAPGELKLGPNTRGRDAIAALDKLLDSKKYDPKLVSHLNANRLDRTADGILNDLVDMMADVERSKTMSPAVKATLTQKITNKILAIQKGDELQSIRARDSKGSIYETVPKERVRTANNDANANALPEGDIVPGRTPDDDFLTDRGAGPDAFEKMTPEEVMRDKSLTDQIKKLFEG
jgi:hypothetical protein